MIKGSGIARSSRPEVFSTEDVLDNFAKFTGKHLHQSLSFNKVADLNSQRCFSVEIFAKFLRTPFFIEYLQWLLLDSSFSRFSEIVVKILEKY